MGDLAGGLLGFIGQAQTNQKNWDIAQSNNQFSAQQFATRYQTTVKDLEAAGLNPMLAYSQGGGTPPTASPVAPMQNALGAGVDSYNRTKATSSQSALQKEQESVAQSQVHLNSATAAKEVAQANVANEQANLIKEDVQKRRLEQPQVEASTKAFEQQATASAAQAAQSYKLVEQLTQNIQNLKAELKTIQQKGDVNAPEADIAKKYPTFYYIFHKLMPSLSGSTGNISQYIPR